MAGRGFVCVCPCVVSWAAEACPLAHLSPLAERRCGCAPPPQHFLPWDCAGGPGHDYALARLLEEEGDGPEVRLGFRL